MSIDLHSEINDVDVMTHSEHKDVYLDKEKHTNTMHKKCEGPPSPGINNTQCFNESNAANTDNCDARAKLAQLIMTHEKAVKVKYYLDAQSSTFKFPPKHEVSFFAKKKEEAKSNKKENRCEVDDFSLLPKHSPKVKRIFKSSIKPFKERSMSLPMKPSSASMTRYKRELSFEDIHKSRQGKPRTRTQTMCKQDDDQKADADEYKLGAYQSNEETSGANDTDSDRASNSIDSKIISNEDSKNKKRLSSPIRKLQVALQEQQIKDMGRNYKRIGDGQHELAGAAALKTVREARRQRSRSRTKHGKKKLDQLQRPFRRWLGVSTCVASDTRFIVASDKTKAATIKKEINKDSMWDSLESQTCQGDKNLSTQEAQSSDNSGTETVGNAITSSHYIDMTADHESTEYEDCICKDSITTSQYMSGGEKGAKRIRFQLSPIKKTKKYKTFEQGQCSPLAMVDIDPNTIIESGQERKDHESDLCNLLIPVEIDTSEEYKTAKESKKYVHVGSTQTVQNMCTLACKRSPKGKRLNLATPDDNMPKCGALDKQQQIPIRETLANANVISCECNSLPLHQCSDPSSSSLLQDSRSIDQAKLELEKIAAQQDTRPDNRGQSKQDGVEAAFDSAQRGKKKSSLKSLMTMIRGSAVKPQYINVQAIKDCAGTLPGQLKFKKGQIIKQLDTSVPAPEGLYYGYYRAGKLRKRMFGIFHSSHVTYCANSCSSEGKGPNGKASTCGQVKQSKSC